MALLQIAEPGRAAAPHQHRLAVGIDLGTTNSLVATLRSGLPTVLADEDGRMLLPSVVHYADGGEIIVGDAARALAIRDPQNTIASAKRLIGRAAADIAPGTVPYTLSELGPGAIGVATRAGVKSAVEVGTEGFEFAAEVGVASSTVSSRRSGAAVSARPRREGGPRPQNVM